MENYIVTYRDIKGKLKELKLKLSPNYIKYMNCLKYKKA